MNSYDSEFAIMEELKMMKHGKIVNDGNQQNSQSYNPVNANNKHQECKTVKSADNSHFNIHSVLCDSCIEDPRQAIWIVSFMILENYD